MDGRQVEPPGGPWFLQPLVWGEDLSGVGVEWLRRGEAEFFLGPFSSEAPLSLCVVCQHLLWPCVSSRQGGGAVISKESLCGSHGALRL